MLNKNNKNTLARWCCELNCFKWPKDFPISSPVGYENMTGKEQLKNKKAKVAWWIIKHIVSKKRQFHYWYTSGFYCGFNKTDSGFEEWWIREGKLFVREQVALRNQRIFKWIKTRMEENHAGSI